jgi:hypothetical protein
MRCVVPFGADHHGEELDPDHVGQNTSPMANGILREKLKTRIASALAEVASASDIEHIEMRGDVAEHAFRELIGDLVPAWAKIGTGKIVDAQGGQSLQIDTAMYSPFVLPPILVHKKGDDLLIPVEACISTVEVKSRLNAAELRRAIANAHFVRALSYVGAPHRQQKAMAANGPTCCLLALSTDLAADGKSELERYIEQDPQAMRTPALNMVCVLGRGLWLFGASGLWQY